MVPLLAFTRFTVCVGSVAWSSLLASPLLLNPGSYELNVETWLPHLEENLRYATTRQQFCLGTQEASTLFPILCHAAFTGCALAGGELTEGRLEYALACQNPYAASGSARLSVRSARADGVLEIKMGGKSHDALAKNHRPARRRVPAGAINARPEGGSARRTDLLLYGPIRLQRPSILRKKLLF